MFKRLNLNVKWITDYDPNQFKLLQGFKNTGEISLYYKHLHCINEQVQNSIDKILIFEDDVLLPDNFNIFYKKCIGEFSALNGDIMFLGTCCNILVNNPIIGKYVYYDASYLSRCSHCYVVTNSAAHKILKCAQNINMSWDFKLNECIKKEKLRSCYTHPSIPQTTNLKMEKSSLGN